MSEMMSEIVDCEELNEIEQYIPAGNPDALHGPLRKVITSHRALQARVRELEQRLEMREQQVREDEQLLDAIYLAADGLPSKGESTGRARVLISLPQQIAALRSKVTEMWSEPCVWTENDSGWWETTCQNEFSLTDGSPAENGMNFCPYCGRLLKEQAYVREE